uniref:Uncharacterized protein n=1 Tax=Romanomermis culicivorax TaxID=13658 RepID=A0A915IG79_ROMCU
MKVSTGRFFLWLTLYQFDSRGGSILDEFVVYMSQDKKPTMYDAIAPDSNEQLQQPQQQQQPTQDGRLGELARKLKIPAETLRFDPEFQTIARPPGTPVVKIPDELLQDPFKSMPSVDPVDQFHRAEMKLYEEIRRYRAASDDKADKNDRE